MVFQSYALYPHLSVRDNIAFPLKPRGMSRAARHREAERVAELLDLTELLHRKPRQLSGGQQQRVALARALVRRPSVFLMDEPLSNLDARLRTETRADLVRLQHRLGTTTIYVTHDQVEALTMADRIAVLDSGQLQQLGTPDEIYDTPANVVVAGFVGDPPMNLWAAEITPSGSVMVEGVEIANAACVPRQLGTSVVVGVRPEAVELADTGLPAKVDWVDDLGHEHLIGCTTRRGGAPCCMRWRGHGRPPVLGSPVHAYIDPARIHWFDTRSGRRIPCG
jgi:multiple sugar transport system ATP-binding protein